MPRGKRIIVGGLPHHVMQRGNNRQIIFTDERDRLYYLKELRELTNKYSVRIGAYCLMTNHIHLLLYPKAADALILVMKHLGQRYSQWFNKKYNRSGKLWENRYKLQLVDPDFEWVVTRYIDRNPLRARMVDRAEDYPYSSARSHAADSRDPLLTKDVIENRRDDYILFLYDSKPADNSVHGTVWGSQDFIQKIESKTGCRLRILAPGRKSG